VLSLADPARIARESLGRLALHLASEAVGGTETCIALASGYANQRQAFGQAIGKFQAVKHAIAEMYVANELARASILDAAVRLQNGEADSEAYVAAARLNAVHAYESSAAAATQVHGGIGVTWEADMHLHYRRSRCLAVEAAPPWFWEDRIATYLEAA
jgi:alkylation response protein AidB-like acyl-CoA dehydrogenase